MTDQTMEQGALTEKPVPLVRDYIELMKPRIMMLVVFTAAAGLIAAPIDIHPFKAFVALLAVAVGSGAAGAINMWYDFDIDAVMTRTATRPLPSGRVKRDDALALGTFVGPYVGAELTSLFGRKALFWFAGSASALAAKSCLPWRVLALASTRSLGR